MPATSTSYSAMILGDSATQFLAKDLRKQSRQRGIELHIEEADYGQVDALLLDPESTVYKHAPNFLIIFLSVRKLIGQFYNASEEGKALFSEAHIHRLRSLLGSLHSRSSAKVILLNYPELEDNVYGHFGSTHKSSLKFQLKRINLELMTLSQDLRGLYICDVSTLANYHGLSDITHSALYVTSDIVYSLDFTPEVATGVLDIVTAQVGQSRKCLILDLDHTLWGGVIADDGIENIEIGSLGVGKAFSEFQLWLKQLRQRGILLCVCSKNTEHIAKAPFQEHPEMILRLDDFAVFVANWEPKADNIRFIQSVLNIGLDSMVFVDDSAFERDMVASHLPDISVPVMPEDPAEYTAYLQRLNLFEPPTISTEDSARTLRYQEEAMRVSEKRQFVDEGAYLATLQMAMRTAPFDRFTIPRVAQLIQRSNQFNLRTVRYSESDIARIADSSEYITICFSLEDRFGEYGVIGALILKRRAEDEAFIDTWVMSCRVLKRGAEHFMVNEILSLSQTSGISRIIGEYIPTPKNALVSDLYESLGFQPMSDETWVLDAKSASPSDSFIKRI